MGRKIILTCDQCGKSAIYCPGVEREPHEWRALDFFRYDRPTQCFCSAECEEQWRATSTLTTEDENEVRDD